jgi:hypothetical protein
MSTAASTSQANQRPTNSFTLSIQRDSFNSAAKMSPRDVARRCATPAAATAEALAF